MVPQIIKKNEKYYKNNSKLFITIVRKIFISNI